jgi:peptidoglycan endopeptidase LytF
MYKYISFLLLATLLEVSAAKAEITRDSIGVENLKGKKVIIHRIVAHDTYYSVARRYNVSPKDIMTYNEAKYLSIGVVIKVPTQLDFNEVLASKTQAQQASAEGSPTTGQEVEYSVVAKDNLNRIAERFGTTVGEIKRINSLRSINLHIGQVLRIPTKAEQTEVADTQTSTVDTTPIFPSKTKAADNTRKPSMESTKVPAVDPKVGVIDRTGTLPAGRTPGGTPANTPAVVASKPQSAPAPNESDNEEFIEHTVASNETIYSIATTFHMTMDQLKAKNNLTTNSLHVGQKLIIKGQYPRVPQQTASEPLSGTDTTLKNPSLRGAPSKYGLNQVDEKGTGIWIIDPDLDPLKMLVLHRSAPIGTIIKVTNPMTNRSTFAKVVGKFTENESTRDVIIVMTKAVAESIGALDKRFFCNLTYSGQEIEQ